MNALDVVLISVFIIALVRGAKAGLWRQVILALGMFIGLAAAVLLTPLLLPVLGSYLTKPLITAVSFVVLITAFGGVFEVASEKANARVQRHKHGTATDSILGSIFSLLASVLFVWLAAVAFAAGPFIGLSADIKNSAIVHVLNARLPAPPAQVIDLQHLLSQVHLPQVFVDGEPAPNTQFSEPSQADVKAVYNKVAASVVQITGYGCGGVLEGSGFVAADNLVVTNAHVVAGVRQPVVHDSRGVHRTTVVYFNPGLDIAVLRTSNLIGQPLALATETANRSTFGVVMGYPGGGPLTGNGGYIASSQTAVGRDIYGQGLVHRAIYVLAADVEPGNSGGPFVLADGRVAGVVFARSESYQNVGYAINTREISSIVSQSQSANSPVGTASCAE